MLLSVIVPVYNAGEYLKPCVESLLALPWETEIIVVDDGSDDDCVVKLNVKSEKLIVLSQVNQGVSAARNAGLKVAKGDWVWFVDADDVVNINTTDIAINSTIADTTANARLTDMLLLPFIWEENGVATSFQAHDGEIPYNLWRCWFRRELIEKFGIHFVVGRKYAEDQEFVLQYLLRTHSVIKALEGPVYHYTMRASGAMMRKNVRWKQRWDVWCVLWGFIARTIISGSLTKQWTRQQIKRLFKNLTIL